MPNITTNAFFEKHLHKTLYEEDGWAVQEHKLTHWLRLLDPSKQRRAWGSRDGFKQAFIALLQSREILEDIKPKQALTIKRLQSNEEFLTFSPIISQLEKGIKYPLGDDFFEIDHGKNYFAFFQRLGKVHYYVVMDGKNVCAVACGVIRSLRSNDKSNALTDTWYLCDLKVVPKYRNQKISMYLITREVPRGYTTCARGYLISMNPEGGLSKNKVVAMLRKFKWAPVSIGVQLNLYSLSSKEMEAFAPTLEKHRGKLSYLSLSGVKDIVLESTHQPMPLLHVQFGPCAAPGQFAIPQEGATHMFCTPDNDALAKVCQDAGLKPTATASLLHHRMSDWDWSFILTSDI